jgi:hypothetical protein|tara:strand:+ start:228 stop:455 length:228 start_codon:yes stop_codon:yes gene_type:complete
MAKTKKTPFDLYDKKYFVEDLNQTQAVLFQHIGDLERKTKQLIFNLDQLTVGKLAFIDKLNLSLNEETLKTTKEK